MLQHSTLTTKEKLGPQPFIANAIKWNLETVLRLFIDYVLIHCIKKMQCLARWSTEEVEQSLFFALTNGLIFLVLLSHSETARYLMSTF